MHRVSMATGAQTQTTVNNLNPKVLGTVEAFEEKQVCSAFGPATFAAMAAFAIAYCKHYYHHCMLNFA